ncbi:MAG TPA: ADP-forming succinate--CoA ligase subunit beta [Anaerolineae bacterium]|nr:ADP-forming succinate--CoA ligase subunit beta [Anaerolineae bacterium]HNU04972.1 ADP-forming succinate--CoA ligase subunit beta [Anaerolineae bacterium]
MNLHEYQSKRIFAQYGIPIPRGEVASTPTEAREIAGKLGGKVVVKSQVLVGGRGKAGGIKLAVDKDDAEEKAKAILGMDIKGLTVKRVLVDEAADIKDEIYLGLVIDRARRRVVMMGSSEGGVDIEEVAATMPDKIVKVAIDPCIGFRSYQAMDLATALGIPKELTRSFGQIASGLYTAFVENDASLAEINPLVVTGDGKLLAVDGKMSIDDNALYRHKALADLRDPSEEDPYEVEARRFDLSYVKLDGNIGCMVNGAGLSMATMDMIKLYGGAPANFLDIGGGATAERVAAALRIILSDQNVKTVLINIFGGITRCDEVARGIVAALDEVGAAVPMVVRLVGTNEAEGRAILADAKMDPATTLAEAAQKAVAASKS